MHGTYSFKFNGEIHVGQVFNGYRCEVLSAYIRVIITRTQWRSQDGAINGAMAPSERQDH